MYSTYFPVCGEQAYLWFSKQASYGPTTHLRNMTKGPRAGGLALSYRLSWLLILTGIQNLPRTQSKSVSAQRRLTAESRQKCWWIAWSFNHLESVRDDSENAMVWWHSVVLVGRFKWHLIKTRIRASRILSISGGYNWKPKRAAFGGSGSSYPNWFSRRFNINRLTGAFKREGEEFFAENCRRAWKRSTDKKVRKQNTTWAPGSLVTVNPASGVVRCSTGFRKSWGNNCRSMLQEMRTKGCSVMDGMSGGVISQHHRDWNRWVASPLRLLKTRCSAVPLQITLHRWTTAFQWSQTKICENIRPPLEKNARKLIANMDVADGD